MKIFSAALAVMVSAACSSDPGSDEDGAIAVPIRPPIDMIQTLRKVGDERPAHGMQAMHRSLVRGADRLAALQADAIGDNAHNGVEDSDPDDGGWDFIVPSSTSQHTGAASPPNLYGETAIGALAAVAIGSGGPRALVAALDAGLAMQHDPDIDSPPDFAFGVLLADVADNPGFAEVARRHYDAKRAAAGGAAGLGAQIRDARHARDEDGLIAYDVGWLSISAAALDTAFPDAGYDADAQIYAQIIVDDLSAANPNFDVNDPSEGSYVLGLAWSQVAALRLGAVDAARKIQTTLLAQQRTNGAWPMDAADSADNLQATAIAVETLALTDRLSGAARQALGLGVGWLLGQQAASGGWSDAADNELPLVDGEILLALVLARTPDRDLVPAPPPRRGPKALAVHRAVAPVN